MCEIIKKYRGGEIKRKKKRDKNASKRGGTRRLNLDRAFRFRSLGLWRSARTWTTIPSPNDDTLYYTSRIASAENVIVVIPDEFSYVPATQWRVFKGRRQSRARTEIFSGSEREERFCF